MNKNQIKQRIKDKVEKGILEPKNANLVSKLIDDSNINDEEAFSLYQLISSYQRAGLHYNPTITERISDTIHYLKKDKEHSFIQDETKPVNKLILGDNYHALKNLLISYRNQIDVIYIDPPYSCSGDGKKADTNYANSYPRDTLLSLLHPRLELASDLLTDDGVIFVSIDDRNQAYVKCLMDEVFGEDNFISCMPRSTSSGEKTSKFNINTNSDYVLFYCKNVKSFISNDILVGVNKSFEEYANPDNDPNGPWKKDSVLIKIDSGRYGYARYGITNPYTGVTYYPPVYYNEKDRKQWHYIEETFEQKKKEGKVVFLEKEPKTGYGFYIKKYLSEVKKKTSNLPSTCLIDKTYQNFNGTKTLKSIFKESPFAYSKPVSLVKKLISIIDKPNAVVLDFFAGSGTTGQAVMELNKEDGGNRKFILATLKEDNEHNIGIDVCAERLKRVMTGSGYNGETDFVWIKDNKALGGNLEVMDIASIANNSQKIFDEIDETLYDVEKFDNIQNKIKWVCDNFEDTQIVLEDKVED